MFGNCIKYISNTVCCKCRSAEEILLFTFLYIGAAACFLPELFLFTDTLLLAKWYLLIVSLLVAIMIVSIRLFVNPYGLRKCRWNIVFKAAEHAIISVAFLECCYVLGKTCIYEGSSIGEAGTFDNPAGLAVCLSVAFPFVVHQTIEAVSIQKKIMYLLMAIFMGTIIVLTKSRCGMVCISLFVAVYILRIIKCSKWMKILLAIIAAAVVCVFVLTYKKDSTSGRIFILSNTFRLIEKHPWIGYGSGGFEKCYMTEQADFFGNNMNNEYAMLADEVQHPLNEFVYAWVNYGIAAPLLLLSAFVIPAVVCLKQRNKVLSTLQLSVLGVFVFSCFSYPFHYPLPWCIIAANVILSLRCIGMHIKTTKGLCAVVFVVCSLLMCIVLNDAWHEYKWDQAWRHLRKKKDGALEEYASVRTYFSSNRYFLYNYAFVLYAKGMFAQSISAGNQCQEYWNGYNLQLLMGDAHRMSKEYEKAISCYEIARCMCPSRFAPLEGMYLAYDAMGLEKEKHRIADVIALQAVKIPSFDAYRIKEYCKY